MVTRTRRSCVEIGDILASVSPIRILHRGGIVGPDSPEGSPRAAHLAGKQGFEMLELDIQESCDHVPMVFHERSLRAVTGVDGRIQDYTARDLSDFFLNESDQKIPTLGEQLEVCRKFAMGVMLDFKVDVSEGCYATVNSLIKKFNLQDSTLTISSFPRAMQALSKVSYMRLDADEFERIGKRRNIQAPRKFWFGWPRFITCELVRMIQDRGIPVVPSINKQHYPAGEHMARAQEDIARMMKAGVTGFQIDSVYADML